MAAAVALIASAAAAVAECRKYEKYDDPYPDVSVFKNIAKAVHYYILRLLAATLLGCSVIIL